MAVHKVVRFANSADDDTHDGGINMRNGNWDDVDIDDVEGDGDDDIIADDTLQADGKSCNDGTDAAVSVLVVWLVAADDNEHKILAVKLTGVKADAILRLDLLMSFHEKTLF